MYHVHTPWERFPADQTLFSVSATWERFLLTIIAIPLNPSFLP